MTIKEAIDRADAEKPNQFSEEQKVIWLSQCDSNIHEDILMTHEDTNESVFTPYDTSKVGNALLAPFPYDELYVAFLKMKFDEKNEDTARYNNSSIIFNAHLDNFAKYINKNHKPSSKQKLRIWY